VLIGRLYEQEFRFINQTTELLDLCVESVQVVSERLLPSYTNIVIISCISCDTTLASLSRNIIQPSFLFVNKIIRTTDE